jgi:hypothetical protein
MNHLLIHSDIKVLLNAWVLTSADLNILIMFVNSNNQLFIMQDSIYTDSPR